LGTWRANCRSTGQLAPNVLQETLETNGIEGKLKDSLIDDSVLSRTVCLFFVGASRHICSLSSS